MANWATLKTAITNVIKTNNNQEITGQVLQDVLVNIVSTVGKNATFAGVVRPNTNPGIFDGPIFYIAVEKGKYVNFKNFELTNSPVIFYSKTGDNNYDVINFCNIVANSLLGNIKIELKDGYYNNHGRYINVSDWSCTEFLPTRLIKINSINLTGTSTVSLVAFFDSNKHFISGHISASPNRLVDIPAVPENALYFTVSVYKNDSQSQFTFSLNFDQLLNSDAIDELENIRTTIATNSADIIRLNTKLTNAETDIDTLNFDTTKIRNNVKDLNAKLTNAETDIDTLNFDTTKIRNNVKDLNANVTFLTNSDNVFKYGGYIDDNGVKQEDTSYLLTDLIRINPLTGIRIKHIYNSDRHYAVIFFDSNKNFISGFKINNDSMSEDLFFDFSDIDQNSTFFAVCSDKATAKDVTIVNSSVLELSNYVENLKNIQKSNSALTDDYKLRRDGSDEISRFATLRDVIVGKNTTLKNKGKIVEINYHNGYYFAINKTFVKHPEWTCGVEDVSNYTKAIILFSCSNTDGDARTFFTDSSDNVIGKALSSDKYLYDIPENASKLYISSRRFKNSALDGAVECYVILYNGDIDPVIPMLPKPIFDNLKSYIVPRVNTNTQLIADYELRRDGSKASESSEISLDVTVGEYYNAGGTIVSNTSYNRAEISLIDGYTNIRLRFYSLSNAAAKSYFADARGNIIEYISSDSNPTGFNTFLIPAGAKKLYISTRNTSDMYPGIPNPILQYYTDEISRFATLRDVKSSNKYLHFSIDDVYECINDIINKASVYASIFDNALLGKLKQWHDAYGIVVSLYLYVDRVDMSNIPEKFKNEFITNKDWLKFGYHSYGVNAGATGTKEQATQWYNDFVARVMQSIGDFEVIDRVPRLDYFHGNINYCKALRDANCGCIGFLGCDDWAYNSVTRETNYYLTDEQNAFLDRRDRLYDYENQLVFFKTDFRLEQIAQRWGDIINCLDDYKKASRAMEAYDMIIFSHEDVISNYYSTAETIFSWAIKNGYNFDYPMNVLLK